MMKKLCSTLTSFLVCYSLFGQTATAENIQALDWLIGKWSLVATETATDNAAFKEVGFQTCSWALHGQAIRCDMDVHRVESSGRYAKGPSTRSLISYFIYNKKENHYEQIYIRPNGSRTTIWKAEGEATTLTSKLVIKHPTLGMKMTIDGTISRQDDLSIRRVEIINSEDGSLKERYESHAIRLE